MPPWVDQPVTQRTEDSAARLCDLSRILRHWTSITAVMAICEAGELPLGELGKRLKKAARARSTIASRPRLTPL
jgi:hypothetical protein